MRLFKFQHLCKPIGPVNNENKSQAHKKKKVKKKPRLQTILQLYTV